MLVALLTVLVLQAPGVEAQDERTWLRANVAATGGYGFFEVDPDAGGAAPRGAVVGVKVGLHAVRPPLVPGGGRLGFFPALELRQALALGRTEWLGSIGLTVTLWKLIISAGLGYGFSTLGGSLPRGFLAISNQVALKLGSLWAGLGMETALRFGSLGIAGRTLEGRLVLGWEFDLRAE